MHLFQLFDIWWSSLDIINDFKPFPKQNTQKLSQNVRNLGIELFNKYHIFYSKGCKPECVRQDDCPANLACINTQCQDPCPGSCGISAQCVVERHNPICTCPPGFIGNPFDRCILDERPPPNPDVCNPSPCGTNTLCTVLDGGAVCECMNSGYIGNPLVACKPECVLNTECPTTQACINQKCRDPCPGNFFIVYF